MYTRWTQHLTNPDDKEKFIREIYSCRRVLERLKDIVEEDKASLRQSEENIKSYTVPNWDHLQAHRNGMGAYQSEMIRLVDLDQQKGTK